MLVGNFFDARVLWWCTLVGRMAPRTVVRIGALEPTLNVCCPGSKDRVYWRKRLHSMKLDVRLPENGNSNLHGARPVHQIMTMIKWIRTSRLSMKNSLSLCRLHTIQILRSCLIELTSVFDEISQFSTLNLTPSPQNPKPKTSNPNP